MSEITVIDDFFPLDLAERFVAQYKHAPMIYGWKATEKTDPHGHWNYSFNKVTSGNNLADITKNLSGITAEMWKHVKKHVGDNNLVLLRCYINGHTYGTDGYVHVDSRRDDETTTVFYMNEEWFANWAGETIFMDKDRSIITKSVLPKFNRMVIFPSNIPHCARGVSRKCDDLRMTFMFKFRKRRSDTFEKLSAFLSENGATNLKHQKGTLHDHLVRVYQRLENNKFPEHVCLGGGLHSVFGTNAFKNFIFKDSDAQKIVETFGQKPYELAKLFSVIKRPFSLENPEAISDEEVVVKLNNDQLLRLSRETYNELCAMECANLLDQDSFKDNKYPRLIDFWRQNDEKNK